MALTAEEKQKINPGLSAILSFLINGLGQIYNGQIKKGLWLISLSTINTLFILVGAILIGHYLITELLSPIELIIGLILAIVGVVAIAILGIYNVYDAYNVAKRKLEE